ncbi:MAG: archaeal type pilus assembly protein PilA [Methanolobus sp.]|nr:archaeal type pilus assembly protein PilA [Methanolobus sp.]
MKMFKDTKAVSPVIGIMLMLVVTVILAAAVSSTSTGLMKSTEAAPMAVFDVKVAKDVNPNDVNSYMVIKQVTGDAIQTKDLKIVTTNTKANGIQIREKFPGENNTYGGRAVGNVPYWNNVGKGYFGANADVDFGNYTLKPGVSMTAQDYYGDDLGVWDGADYDTTSGLGQMQDMFADWDSVSKGDFVNVKIIHMPSNKVIFSSDVEVV